LKDNEPKTNPPPALELDGLTALEFLFVTGKGGVGKSTVAAMLGLQAADEGKTALIVHPEGSQPHDGLWGKRLTSEPAEMAPGVDAVSISAELSMREYATEILRSRSLVSALFHSKVARGFLTGMPGLSDWAILGKTWSHTRSGTFRLPKGQKQYDLVILDAPASGDGSKMLTVPDVILDLSPAGPMKSDAESCRAMLKDPKRTHVILVALAEELAVAETQENLHLIRDKLGLPVGPIVVNQILGSRFSRADRQAIRRLPLPTADSKPGETLCQELSLDRIAREELQQEHLKRLRELGLPLLQIERVEESLSGVEALKKLEITLAHRH